METTVIRHLASAIDALHRCETKLQDKLFMVTSQEDRDHWKRVVHEWRITIKDLQDNCLPSGSGVDNGTTVDEDASTGEKIVLHTSFHHMDEHGYYDGWTEHTVTIRPSFVHTLDMRISGRNRSDIKEYLHELFYHALTQPYTPAPINTTVDANG